jgi:hypothetical protein
LKDFVSDLSGTGTFNDMVHSRACLLDLGRLGTWVKSLSRGANDTTNCVMMLAKAQGSSMSALTLSPTRLQIRLRDPFVWAGI